MSRFEMINDLVQDMKADDVQRAYKQWKLTGYQVDRYAYIQTKELADNLKRREEIRAEMEAISRDAWMDIDLYQVKLLSRANSYVKPEDRVVALNYATTTKTPAVPTIVTFKEAPRETWVETDLVPPITGDKHMSKLYKQKI